MPLSQRGLRITVAVASVLGALRRRFHSGEYLE
jgi:hypothetical protein